MSTPLNTAALQQQGFCYYPIETCCEAALQNLVAQLPLFFALPKALQSRLHVRQHYPSKVGFVPLDEEITLASAGADHKIIFDLGSRQPQALFDTTLCAAYPQLAPFIDALTQAQQALQHSVQQVFQSLLPTHDVNDWQMNLRLLCYPPTPKQRYGCAPHQDQGLFTLLWQDNVGGLSFCTNLHWENAEWQAMPARAGHCILNLGQLAATQAGGASYPPAPWHQVVNTTSRSRYSIVAFCDPSETARYAAAQAQIAIETAALYGR